MIKLRPSFFLLCATYGLPLMAQEVVRPEDAPLINKEPPPTIANQTPQTVVSISEEQLLESPALTGTLLDQAVITQSWAVVDKILPLYEKLPQRNTELYEYAKARLSHSKGDYDSSIKRYRAIVSEHPDLIPVRLYLAQALFENHEFEAATYQFEKVQEARPAEPLTQIVELYLNRIHKEMGWRFDGSLNYLVDNNINNASPKPDVQVGSLLFHRSASSLPQQGKGFSYGASVARDQFISDHHAISGDLSMFGKTYWNNHDYDEWIGRLSLGYLWQTARDRLRITPYYQYRRFGNKPYLDNTGARAEYSYLIKPNWQVSSAIEYYKTKYKKFDYLNGHSWFASLGSSYAFTPKTTAYSSISLLKEIVAEPSEGSTRIAATLGVVQELPWNISVQAQASYANRRFVDAPNIFGQRRLDKEIGYSVTVWNRRWYKWGLLPKLTFESHKNISNTDIYQYKKHRIFLSMSKSF